MLRGGEKTDERHLRHDLHLQELKGPLDRQQANTQEDTVTTYK